MQSYCLDKLILAHISQFKSKMTLKSRLITYIFNTYCLDKLILARISQFKSKIILGTTPIFNTSREGPKIHLMCEFGECNSNISRIIIRTM